jgi:hypothetical protein
MQEKFSKTERFSISLRRGIPRRPFNPPFFEKILHYYLEKMQVIAILQRRIYFPVKQIYTSDEKD